jgi:Transcription elongation factor, GreA/GreB, C-term
VVLEAGTHSQSIRIAVGDLVGLENARIRGHLSRLSPRAVVHMRHSPDSESYVAGHDVLMDEFLQCAADAGGVGEHQGSDASTRARDVVGLGAHAEFEDLATGERSSYELVSSPESNVARGRLSVTSPVGRALYGHHAGDTVEVVTPRGRRRLRVVAIR